KILLKKTTFERLVLHHIKACLPPTFTWNTGRSTLGCSSLTTAQPSTQSSRNILVRKLSDLGLHPLSRSWIRDFLSDRPQKVKLGLHFSSTRTLRTGSPQGCVLSPLLYSLYTHDCSPNHPGNTIVKFADDTAVVGLISGGDESEYRDEILKITSWCSNNNLSLNTTKTKEIILDFRNRRADPAPLYINGDCVERVRTFSFLGTTISADLSWTANMAVVIKKPQQRLHFLRVLRRNKLLVTFYRSSIESVLTFCISVRYSQCTEADRNKLQRVINTAQKITGYPLPSLKDIYTSRCLSRADRITRDSSEPGFYLFDLLPSGRRYRSIRTRPSRFRDSFFPNAITTLTLPHARTHTHTHTHIYGQCAIWEMCNYGQFTIITSITIRLNSICTIMRSRQRHLIDIYFYLHNFIRIPFLLTVLLK
uniref:Reverse transcriptase domain-containing protein n=1 Tax=Scophthalmus maximus TaxID=52904 RepID=A0A8D3DB29_SCOMX